MISRRAQKKDHPDRKGLAPLDLAVKDFLKTSGIVSRLGAWPIYQAFLQAAGSTFERRARPVRFARGTLTVEVDSAAHLAELQGFRGGEIRARANEILGRPDIQKIAFKLKR
jgi:hypothetical protein